MKKSLLALTVALSFGIAAAQTEAPASAPQVPALTDVPAGHWAKDAIDRLVGSGVILGFPDGTYRGTQNLTRYEAAVIIARLLDQIKTGDVPASSISAEDLAALQNAIQELAADLAALGVRVSDLEENAVSKDDFARLEARIEEVAGAQGDQEAVAAIQAQIDDLTARADEYDTLRADVDDNASSIAALNDLTVLLNQDILDLQDRVSAVEAAQADFVQRSDFDNLSGRVTAVETKVDQVNNSLTGRIAALERTAFSIKPTLTVSYLVSRANRNFDIDRLFPLNADGTNAANAFTTDGKDGDTSAFPRDYGDFGNSQDIVLQGPEGLYGFASAVGPKYYEGRTRFSFGITFGNSGQFKQVTSASGGSLFTTKGALTVNKIDVDFSLVAGLPDGAYVDINGNGSKEDGEAVNANDANKTTFAGNTAAGTYAIRDGDGNFYQPLYFKFNNASVEFSVGNNPVIVTLGRKMKFYFADYAFDNDYEARGDGYKVQIDGSNLPVIGAWKPQILGVYGSRRGAAGNVYGVASTGTTGDVGYGVYYRGLRAQITPIGTLTLGAYYAQEGKDSFGATSNTTAPTDVTVYGADAHGKAFGVELHSEFSASRVNPYDAAGSTADTYSANAFYARIATRKSEADGRAWDLDTPAAKFGTDMFNVKIYDLNYRKIDAKVTSASTLSETSDRKSLAAATNSLTAADIGYQTHDLGSKQNLAFDPDHKNDTTAPFANLLGRTSASQTANGVLVGQSGFGVKAAVTLGPVAVGGYYDNSSSADNASYNRMVEAGAGAKVGFSIFTLSGAYNSLNSDRLQTYNDASGTSVTAAATVRRYAVQADVALPRGFWAGAYYRDVNVNGARSTTDRGLLGRGYLISHFRPNSSEYGYGSGCAQLAFGTSIKDKDGVGNVLNPASNITDDSTSTCFTSFGVVAGHAGDAKDALVKDLWFRVGYSQIYDASTNGFTGRLINGDARYDHKIGPVNLRIAGAISNSNIRLDDRPAGTRGAFGVIARTDPLTNLPFSPSLNGQVGYYTSQFGPAGDQKNANALKYGAGIVLNDFLLPDTKIGVRYDGYRAYNRKYVDFKTEGGAGYFMDDNNGRTTNLSGVYVEGAYKDMVFSYGQYTLSQKDAAGVEYGSGLGDGKAAKGQTFKINYKVTF